MSDKNISKKLSAEEMRALLQSEGIAVESEGQKFVIKAGFARTGLGTNDVTLENIVLEAGGINNETGAPNTLTEIKASRGRYEVKIWSDGKPSNEFQEIKDPEQKKYIAQWGELLLASLNPNNAAIKDEVAKAAVGAVIYFSNQRGR